MQDTPGARRYYSSKADIWSIGAILYYMIYGQPPSYQRFAADPPPGKAPHPNLALNNVLYRTLVLDPDARAGLNSLRSHPFTLS